MPVLGPEVPVQENLAKSFSRFLSGGGPDLCTGGLLQKFPGHRKFRPLTSEVPTSRGCNGQTFGEAINSLLLPQEEAALSFPLSFIV